MVNLNVNANLDYAQILFFAASNNKLISNNSPVSSNTSGDFKQLIVELLNKNFTEEKINIIENLINNEKLYNSLNQAVAFFIITGEIKNIPLIPDAELENNNMIREISFSNNLNPAERNLLIKSLKFAAIEVVTNTPEIESSIQNIPVIQQSNNKEINLQFNKNNMPGENDYPANINSGNNINKISISQTLRMADSYVVYENLIENNNPIKNNIAASQNASLVNEQIIENNKDNIQQINQNYSIANLDIKANIVNSGKIVLAQPLIPNNNTVNNTQTDSKIVNNITSDTIKVLKTVDSNSSNIMQDVQGNTVKILNNITEIIYGIKESADKLINENNIDQNSINNINELKLKMDNIINLANKIKQAITDNKAEILQSVKQNTELLIREIISIIPVIQNIIYKENTQNNFVAILNNKIANVEMPAVNTNSQQIINSGFKNENKNPSYQNETRLFNEIKDSVMKIFTLLKELNGEMQIYKKIEFVYQPNTAKTSTVTPDGVLLINLSPIDKSNNLSAVNRVSEITSENLSINENSGIINIPVANNDKTIPIILNSGDSDELTYEVIPQNLIENKQKFNIQPEIANVSLKQDIIEKNSNDLSFIMNSIIDNLNKNQIIDKSDKNNLLNNIIQTGYKIKEDIVIRQVIEKITDAISIKEKVQIKIYLKPENLGPVYIRIENKGKEVSANIQVTNNEVKDILKANIPELKNSLNNLGLDVKEFEISMMNQNIGNNLSDASKNIYKEWEGAAIIDKNVQEVVDVTDIYNAGFSYLDYLA